VLVSCFTSDYEHL